MPKKKKRPEYLTLLPIPDEPEMTQEEMYGHIFCAYAEQISDLKNAARQLMMDALNKGLDPKKMDSELSLVELDLAMIEYAYNGDDYTVTYLEPNDLTAIINPPELNGDV